MRTITVAILSLSSFMLHAQVNSPAQTQITNSGSGPQIRRISTGVIPPRLIYKVDVLADSAETSRMLNEETKVVVGMMVDKVGKPHDLKILQSAGAAVDSSVLTAVAQYRFTPGTVSNEPMPTPLNLEVVISNIYR
jgi:TonB family protein